MHTALGGTELGIKMVTTHLGFALSICTTSLGQTVMGGISMGKTVICVFYAQLNLLSIIVRESSILMQRKHNNAVWLSNYYLVC